MTIQFKDATRHSFLCKKTINDSINSRKLVESKLFLWKNKKIFQTPQFYKDSPWRWFQSFFSTAIICLIICDFLCRSFIICCLSCADNVSLCLQAHKRNEKELLTIENGKSPWKAKPRKRIAWPSCKLRKRQKKTEEKVKAEVHKTFRELITFVFWRYFEISSRPWELATQETWEAMISLKRRPFHI